jgi:hypothetical protein
MSIRSGPLMYATVLVKGWMLLKTSVDAVVGLGEFVTVRIAARR